MEFHNNYMNIQKQSLVEFHDIDNSAKLAIIKLWSSTIGEVMIITFIGHSSLITCDNLLAKIKKTILDNTKADENISFFCGGYGEFDNLSVLACRFVKEERPNGEIVFVTPYLNGVKNFEYYDGIIYPPIEGVPPKYAIIKRNEWMIDKADLVIAYVKHKYGGAYKSLLCAQKRKKLIINLAESE